MILEKAANGER